MAKTVVSGGAFMPNWLAWYLNYGLPKSSDRDTRKQAALNASMLVGMLPTVFWILFYPIFDISLWPMSVIVTALLLFQLTQPFIYNWSRTFNVFWATAIIPTNFVVQSYFLGAGSAVWMTMILVPSTILVTGGPDFKFSVLFSGVVCCIGMMACLILFQQPALEAARNPVLQGLVIANSVIITTLLVVSTAYQAFSEAETAEDALEAEHARSEALLYNLLPEDIAARLKVEPDRTIADNLPQVAILFADIVNFTPRAAALPPEQVVGFLNKIFSAYDELAEKHGLEKIKTIGDAYMVAAGMPTPCGDPVHRIAEMAIDMQRITDEMAPEFSEGLEVRIDLHAGPVVAGVIGNKKLFYDVWGETVNTASRMESHGEPGRIQVTGPAYEELVGDYEFEKRGTVDVKGMGRIDTWWLTGRRLAA